MKLRCPADDYIFQNISYYPKKQKTMLPEEETLQSQNTAEPREREESAATVAAPQMSQDEIRIRSTATTVSKNYCHPRPMTSSDSALMPATKKDATCKTKT